MREILARACLLATVLYEHFVEAVARKADQALQSDSVAVYSMAITCGLAGVLVGYSFAIGLL